MQQETKVLGEGKHDADVRTPEFFASDRILIVRIVKDLTDQFDASVQVHVEPVVEAIAEERTVFCDVNVIELAA